MPLTSSELDAIALRPMMSCNSKRTTQAGKMAVALRENIINGEIPKPSTFLDIAS